MSKRATVLWATDLSLDHSYLRLQKQPERPFKGPSPLSFCLRFALPHCTVPDCVFHEFCLQRLHAGVVLHLGTLQLHRHSSHPHSYFEAPNLQFLQPGACTVHTRSVQLQPAVQSSPAIGRGSALVLYCSVLSMLERQMPWQKAVARGVYGGSCPMDSLMAIHKERDLKFQTDMFVPQC
jgi:hypothetical protein